LVVPIKPRKQRRGLKRWIETSQSHALAADPRHLDDVAMGTNRHDSRSRPHVAKPT
jgi:hypothetical protein